MSEIVRSRKHTKQTSVARHTMFVLTYVSDRGLSI
jgi:hypothetical protein